MHPRPCVDCHACAPPLQTNENRLQMSVGGQLLQPTSYESMQFESIVVSNIARQSMSFSDADPSAESVELYISEVRAGNRGGKGVAIASRGGLFRGVALVRVEWIAAASALIASNLQPPPLLTHTTRSWTQGKRGERLADASRALQTAYRWRSSPRMSRSRFRSSSIATYALFCALVEPRSTHPHTHTHTHTHTSPPRSRAQLFEGCVKIKITPFRDADDNQHRVTLKTFLPFYHE